MMAIYYEDPYSCKPPNYPRYDYGFYISARSEDDINAVAQIMSKYGYKHAYFEDADCLHASFNVWGIYNL